MTNHTTAKKQCNVASLEETTNSTEQSKNFLTETELNALLQGASKTRYSIRNQAIILVMFWHGLRVTELCNLNTADFDIKNGRLYVKRIKNGLSTTHPVRPEVMRILKRYLKKRKTSFKPLFINERGDQFTRYPINYMLERASKLSTLPFKVNPHMLRHGCGFALANRGLDTRLIQDYLGHRDITNTAVYTRTAARRFEEIWNNK